MHELLDNQVDTQNKNQKIKIPGFALVEIAIEEKMTATQIFERRTLYYEGCIRRLAGPTLGY